MPVTRERVDPIKIPEELGLVHRRWLLPDDVHRPIALQQAARLWRGLLDAGALDANAEATVRRHPSEELDMPAAAAGGALLAGAGQTSLVTQMVWLEDGHRDPYAEENAEGYRDYTLYAVDDPARLLLPIPPVAHLCASCGKKGPLEVPRFGDAALLELGRVCTCGAKLDVSRDKAELKTGAVFLLEELACRAALSIELPRAPEAEELPDARIAQLLSEAFGGYDELTDDQVSPSE